jgi:HNH endonuclease
MDKPMCSTCGKSGKITRGLCNAHYAQWYYQQVKAGLIVRTKNSRPLVERFMEKVDKNGPVPALCPELGPCWVWTASVNSNGYGKIGVGGKLLAAHRLAYTHFVGEIPEGMEIRHHCDNPPCVNPAHLVPGTHGDNMQDMLERGRGRHSGRTRCDKGHDLTLPGAILHRADKDRCKECTHGREQRVRDQKRGGPPRKLKVNDEQVRAIRARCADGEDIGALAAEYGVSRSYISGIAAGRFPERKVA